MTTRSKKGYFRFPSSLDASLNSAVRNSEAFTKFRHASRDAFDCEDVIVPRISSLLQSSFPSRVFWRIIQIVFNPAKRFSFWAFTFVGQKVLKRRPSFTDGNSSTTVILPIFIVRVLASIVHPCPTGISLGRKSIRGVPVRFMDNFDLLCIKATARFGIPAGNLSPTHKSWFAAFTNAITHAFDFSRRQFHERLIVPHEKSFKRLTYDGFSSRHNEVLSFCSAVGVRQQPTLTAIIQ